MKLVDQVVLFIFGEQSVGMKLIVKDEQVFG